MDEARKGIRNVAGQDAIAVFDLATMQTQFSNKLAQSGSVAIGGALQGENPLYVTGTPLAAAIRAAKETHEGASKPLPDDVKAGLRYVFSGYILDRARYTVGKVDITLPNFIGQGAKFLGNGYAVVVDNVIVFNETPPSFAQNPHWWGHEVAHVKQYSEMGIERFAFEYLRSRSLSIEQDADRYGDAALAQTAGASRPTYGPGSKAFNSLAGSAVVGEAPGASAGRAEMYIA